MKIFSQLLILFIFVLSSCDLIRVKDSAVLGENSKTIARVKDKYLYKTDLEGIVGNESNLNDSINASQRYIQNWIKKQLLISKAESELDFDQAELQRKILDYRYALMVYEYEKLYINNHLNTEVTDEEIEEYYKENKDKFQLKQNILRGVFLQLPKESPKTDEFKSLLRRNSEQAKEKLKTLSIRYTTKSHLEDTVWLKFDNVFQNTPFRDEPNRVQFLRENQKRVIEGSDDNFLYLIRIDEFKIRDEISPIEFIRDDIRTIIINKRKTMLADQLEQEIYDEAVDKNDFEIYEDY